MEACFFFILLLAQGTSNKDAAPSVQCSACLTNISTIYCLANISTFFFLELCLISSLSLEIKQDRYFSHWEPKPLHVSNLHSNLNVSFPQCEFASVQKHSTKQLHWKVQLFLVHSGQQVDFRKLKSNYGSFLPEDIGF